MTPRKKTILLCIVSALIGGLVGAFITYMAWSYRVYESSRYLMTSFYLESLSKTVRATMWPQSDFPAVADMLCGAAYYEAFHAEFSDNTDLIIEKAREACEPMALAGIASMKQKNKSDAVLQKLLNDNRAYMIRQVHDISGPRLTASK